MFKKAREPVNSFTHFIGAVFSALLTVYFLIYGLYNNSNPLNIFSSIVFSISMFALYSASAAYHYSNRGKDVILKLKKLDHAMIYVLIVGSYTPFILRYINPPRGYIFLGILWAIAGVGILTKIFWITCPRVLSTAIYTLLGWAVIFDFKSFSHINIECLLLIAIGGLSYTIGGVIYATKKPNISETCGFHEIFHIFVLLGSFFHFLAVAFFVI